MNQKYLRGTTNGQDSVYFQATVENISAFIMENCYHDGMILTINGLPLLYATMGTVIQCPDLTFLARELLPVLVPMQLGKAKVPTLQKVSKPQAMMKEPPLPDGNYLYLDGVSNELWEEIIHGAGLTKLRSGYAQREVRLTVHSYQQDGNLAIQFHSWEHSNLEPFASLTLNFPGQREKDCAFIDTKKLGSGILYWLWANQLAEPTGNQTISGYVQYPEYRFNPERLKRIDPVGYAKYGHQRERLR